MDIKTTKDKVNDNHLNKTKKERIFGETKDRRIALLPHEAKHHMYDGVGSLATLFEGTAPIEVLRSRAIKILDANPWLASRLITDDRTGLPTLQIPSTPGLSPFFRTVLVNDICGKEVNTRAFLREAYIKPLSMSYADLFARQGFKSIDADEPLFKIRICTGNDGKFVLLLSISHGLGDGTTLYQVGRMLSLSGSIMPLQPERIHTFSDVLAESGKYLIPGSGWLPRSVQAEKNDKYKWLLTSSAVSSTKESRNSVEMNIEENIHWENSPQRSDILNSGIFRVSPDWLKAQKTTFMCPGNDVQWISSTDALTSWFMKRSGVSAGIMFVDARGRIPGLKSSHVGNYCVAFLYYPGEFANPVTIRRSLKAFSPRCINGSQAGPGNRVAFVNNLAPHFIEYNFGLQCQQLLQFPLFPPELGCPTIFDSAMLIFHPRAGELAAGIKTSKMWDICNDSVLEERLNPFG